MEFHIHGVGFVPKDAQIFSVSDLVGYVWHIILSAKASTFAGVNAHQPISFVGVPNISYLLEESSVYLWTVMLQSPEV